MVSQGHGNDRRLVVATAEQLGISPPDDYLEVMTEYDGFSGFVGEEVINVYSLEVLQQLNLSPAWPELPWLVHFGSDGSTYSYCFDKRRSPNPIVAVDFMDWSNLHPIGSSVSELIEHVATLE